MYSYFGWRSQYSIDKEQLERIEELEIALDSQTRRLRSQLAKAQGSLESRLSALARAFDAFVELSDVQAELMRHGDAAVARHRVRNFLTDVLAGRIATLTVSDVPGYWLVPAARAIEAHLAGDTAAAARHMTDATELDATRSTLLLAAIAGLRGLPDMTAGQLADLLPGNDPNEPTEQPVTYAQRALWLAAADGRFGAAGEALLRERLTVLMPPPSSGEERDRWRTAVLGLAGVAATASAQAPRLAAALAALRSHCADALQTPPEASKVDDGESADDPLTTLVNSLVDEGSPAEIPLFERAAELRQIVENRATPRETPPSWNATAGTLTELVRNDFVSGSPASRRIATRVARHWLLAVADDLVAEAATQPPRTTPVRRVGRALDVGRHGVDPEQYAAAERDIDNAFQPPRTPRIVAAVAGATGVVLSIVGFAAGSVWIGVAGLVGAAAAGFKFRELVGRGKDYAEAAATEKAKLRQEIDAAKQRLASIHATAATARREAKREREELAALLS